VKLAIKEAPVDFLFTQGGPGGVILNRLHLLHPQLGVASRRAALVLAALTWVPLFVLSAAQGLLLSGAQIPFLEDIAAHARFLLAVPVLVLAEIPIGFRLREMVRQFLDSGLVREEEMARFTQILDDVLTVRDSRIAEIVILGLAYVTTYLNFTQLGFQRWTTWALPDPAQHFSFAGYWFLLVATPIFQFLVLRWFYRMYVWGRFLWKVSKLDLRLSAAHPDAAGGLGFLGKSLIPFGAITFALSSVISGAIASRVIFAGAQLESFAPVYVALLVVSLIVFVGPLLLFTPRLIRLKYEGMLKYGVLADRYTRLFERKWVELGNRSEVDESVLGSGDIQSLADLGNSFELVRKMRVVPIEPSDFIALALPAIVPAIPLLTTTMSLADIVKDLFRLMG
jgi:hypothetical protein